MADGENTPLNGVPTIGFSEYDEDIEIVSEAEEQATKQKSQADILAEVEALKAQLAKREAPAQPTGVTGGDLEKLISAMRTQQAPAPQRAPAESEEDFKKRFNEKLYDSPYDIMEELLTRKLLPEVQALMQNNVTISRQLTRLDPKYGPIVEKYGEEIEREVRGMHPVSQYKDPEIYKKAADQVMFRHNDEIIAARVEEEIRKRFGDPDGKAPKAQQKPIFNESGNTVPNLNVRTERPSVALTSQDKATAQRRGLTDKQYAMWKRRQLGGK